LKQPFTKQKFSTQPNIKTNRKTQLKIMKNALKNSVVVYCHADHSWLSRFNENGTAVFAFNHERRMILTADDPRLEPYFDAPYEVRDITVTPDAFALVQNAVDSVWKGSFRQTVSTEENGSYHCGNGWMSGDAEELNARLPADLKAVNVNGYMNVVPAEVTVVDRVWNEESKKFAVAGHTKMPWPSKEVQMAYWTAKDDAYAAYLNEMHQRQLDPKYIASYSVWLDDRLEQNDGRDLIVQLVEDYGFVVEDTGGGCQWLRRDLCDGLHMVVTDGEAGLPELTARLYIVKETNGEPIAQSDLMTLHEMIDHVAIALA
jgi:hypothetical protein